MVCDSSAVMSASAVPHAHEMSAAACSATLALLPKHMAQYSPSSRALALHTALTCGALSALALQVVLSQYGLQITDAWRQVSASEWTRAAMVWWVIAGVTLIAGAL